MTHTNTAELAQLAQRLVESGQYRVSHKFDPVVLEPTSVPEDAGIAVVLDTETTGREESDKIIELGLVVFAYDKASGEVYGVVDTYNALEDPGMPIPPEATKVNGITDDMVAGQRIDDERVQALVEMADFVIAHNAGFDRPYCERRFPFFKAKAWACSLHQMDWAAAGMSSAKLEYIAYRLGFFYDAHRAENDCLALLYALTLPLEELEGLTAMRFILQAYLQESRRIWATGSPFEAKDLLKVRGYRWSDGSRAGTEKAWFTDVPAELLEDELAWLKAEVFNRRPFSVPVDTLDAHTRFTDRRGHTERVYR